MYKVFVDNRPLTIAAEAGIINSFEPGNLILQYHGKEELEKVVEMLWTAPPIGETIVYHHDLEKLWSDFKSLFKLVPAAGGLVKNNKGEFLAIFRNGKWDLPKGKIDPGETEAEAAVREVEEECGISGVELGDHLCHTYHMYPNKSNKLVLKPTTWYNMRYAGENSFSPQSTEGISEVAFKSETDLNEIYSNTFESIKTVLEQR